MVAGELPEVGPHPGKDRRVFHLCVADAVDFRHGIRDRLAGMDQCAERRALVDASGVEPDRSDLDQPRPDRIKPRCLGIKHHRIKRDQRSDGAERGHAD
jgi:hypothetical protein